MFLDVFPRDFESCDSVQFIAWHGKLPTNCMDFLPLMWSWWRFDLKIIHAQLNPSVEVKRMRSIGTCAVFSLMNYALLDNTFIQLSESVYFYIITLAVIAHCLIFYSL